MFAAAPEAKRPPSLVLPRGDEHDSPATSPAGATMTDPATASTLDFSNGYPLEALSDQAIVAGKLGGEDLILVRRGEEVFALGARCTHYGGPLSQGLLVGEELRCPLHHACFSLRTGQLLRPPAFDSIPCWRVERVGDRVFIRERLPAPAPMDRSLKRDSSVPASIVIVGGGAAALAAADTLRREGYQGSLTILSADSSAPYDRPNLSKDYLAGEAPEEWLPLRPAEYYSEQNIDLALDSRVTALDLQRRQVKVGASQTYDFDRLLLATGADPVVLNIPGSANSAVYYLRSYADSRTLVAKAVSARQVVIVGGSFIGLEVAAALRARGIGVHIVALEERPLEAVFGPELGTFVRELHEAHGVVFHLKDTVSSLDGRRVILRSGAVLDADFLVLGVGVRPSMALAEQAGLKMDRGIVVDEYLQTSVPGIFAAGDVARWPDPHTGERIRVEHWVVALRQGQAAARNMLGQRKPFDAVPFFWTQQYGVAIKYVGHAASWDEVRIEGSPANQDCVATYLRAGRPLAVATISRDLRNLQAELALETAPTRR